MAKRVYFWDLLTIFRRNKSFQAAVEHIWEYGLLHGVGTLGQLDKKKCMIILVHARCDVLDIAFLFTAAQFTHGWS